MGKSEISCAYPLVGLYVTLLVCWHSDVQNAWPSGLPCTTREWIRYARSETVSPR